MPTRSYKGGDTDTRTTGAAALVLAGVTSNADELLVVGASSAIIDTDGVASAPNLSIADTAGNSWTEVTASHDNGRYSIVTSIFYCQSLGTTTTITVTVPDTGQDEQVAAMHVYGYTDHNGVGATGTQQGDDVAETITLSGAPAATSEVIGIIGANEFGLLTFAPSTGASTELHETHLDSASKTDHSTLFQNSAGLSVQTQVRDDGSTGTSFAWTMTTNNLEYGQAEVAIEVTNGSLGTGSPPSPAVVDRRYFAPVTKPKLGGLKW